MADLNYFGHESPTGRNYDVLLKSIRYDAFLIGENLAMNNSSKTITANVAINGLLESKSHYANIISEAFSHLGIGYSYSEEDKMHYFAQIFARKSG